MKKSTKILLTILLIVTVIVSVLGSVSAFMTFGDIYDEFYTEFSILAEGVRSSERADAIVSTLFSFTSVILIGVLAILFIFIAIGCAVGIIYIFVGDSDTRIKELEAIVDEAHQNIKHDEPNYYEENLDSETLNIE